MQIIARRRAAADEIPEEFLRLGFQKSRMSGGIINGRRIRPVFSLLKRKTVFMLFGRRRKRKKLNPFAAGEENAGQNADQQKPARKILKLAGYVSSHKTNETESLSFPKTATGIFPY